MNSPDFNGTMSRICDAMNAQMRDWKASRAIPFRDVPNGAQFVFVTFDDHITKTKTSARLYRASVFGKAGRCFTTGAKVLCPHCKHGGDAMTPEMRKWLNAASRFGGSFVTSFAETCLYADDDNFELLKPILLQLMEKYPHYSTDRFNAGE